MFSSKNFRFLFKKILVSSALLFIWATIIAIVIFDIYIIYTSYRVTGGVVAEVKSIFPSLTVLMIAVIYLQYRSTMDWNRRQLATLETSRILKENKEVREILNEKFDLLTEEILGHKINYSTMMMDKKKPFGEDFLHQLMCVHSVDIKTKEIKYEKENTKNEKSFYKLTMDG